MSEKLHPFVEDIGRWFDADVCDVRMECRLLGFKDRFAAAKIAVIDLMISDEIQRRP
jgi:hypothetical protein